MRRLSITGFLIGVIGMLLPSAIYAQSSLSIQKKPLIFDSLRSALSLEYLEDHYGILQKEPTILPTIIVLHWTVIPTVQATFKALDPPTLPNSRTEIQSASALNVSAHYLVDRDGTIYQLLPDTLFARHVIGLNYCAIGIENIGSDQRPLTDAQLKANVALIRILKKKYPIQYVIGHYEYKEFRNTPLWKEKDPSYLTQKQDPGASFMRKIRKATQDLELKGAPLDKSL